MKYVAPPSRLNGIVTPPRVVATSPSRASNSKYCATDLPLRIPTMSAEYRHISIPVTNGRLIDWGCA